jgi:hypothetical protein
VGLIVEALFSAGLVASVVEAPNCFLRADACALAPNAGGTILLVPVGAAGYLISSSFFKVGLAGTILVGPAVAGPVVAVYGVTLLASVPLIVSLFSLSCLSLSSYSFFSSTALAALLAGWGFTGSLDGGGFTVLLAGATGF